MQIYCYATAVVSCKALRKYFLMDLALPRLLVLSKKKILIVISNNSIELNQNSVLIILSF